MGKDYVPKIDGYWLFKQKTLDACGAFGVLDTQTQNGRKKLNACCVQKDCFVLCVEQCYRFVIVHFIPKSRDDVVATYPPLLGVWDKECCGGEEQWVLTLVSGNTNATFKLTPVAYKGKGDKCVKCLRYIAYS